MSADNLRTREPLTESSPDWQRARMLGRREALNIILGQNAEDFPEEFQKSRPLADIGDYITYWNEDKLAELLDAKEPSALIERLERGYWEQVYEIDELRRERDELKAWKESALAVESEWDVQELAKMLGAKPGQSCRRVIHERVIELLASHAEMCARLQECVQKHQIGLGGEKLDKLVCDEITAMREAIKEARDAILRLLNNGHGDRCAWINYANAACTCGLDAGHWALAKLQPFIGAAAAPATEGGAE